MRPRLALLAACLLMSTTARAGEIYYGRYTRNPSLFQFYWMDSNGQNKAPVFSQGAPTLDDVGYSDTSHANYDTAFARGRLWLSIEWLPAPSGELRVFARDAGGRFVSRRVTDFTPDGMAVVDATWHAGPRWALDDGFISCRVIDRTVPDAVPYLVRIAVSGDEIASAGFEPIPFSDPANPTAINPRIEVLVRDGGGHAWSPDGTRLAYLDYSTGGFRIKAVGPLGTFAGPTEPAFDPVLVPAGTFSYLGAIDWRPVAGSDQLVFFGREQYRANSSRNGIFFAYANSRTTALFLENKYDSKTKATPAYRNPQWTADGNTIVMTNGESYVCKVPAAGGAVVNLTTAAEATTSVDLYGAR